MTCSDFNNLLLRRLLTISVLAITAGFPVFAAEQQPETQQKQDPDPSRIPGIQSVSEGVYRLDSITIDARSGTVSFPVELNMKTGLVELITCTTVGRTHESLFLVRNLDPLNLQLALYLAKGHNGSRNPASAEYENAGKYRIEVQYGNTSREPVESWTLEENSRQAMPKTPWIFVGSAFDKGQCLASAEGNLIDINSRDTNTIVGAPETDAYRKKQFIINPVKTESLKAASWTEGGKPEPGSVLTLFLVPMRGSNP